MSRRLKIQSRKKGERKTSVQQTERAVDEYFGEEPGDTSREPSPPPQLVERSPDWMAVPETDETPWQINPGLTRRRAKELYMIYYWSKDQLLDLGIPESLLNSWLYNPSAEGLSWKQERDMFEGSILARMKERAGDEMSKALSRSMAILNRSLTEADLDGMKLKSPREYKDMMGVIKDLKNLVNLEEGKPTSIKKNVSLTQKEALELVQQLQDLDPLINYDPTGEVN